MKWSCHGRPPLLYLLILLSAPPSPSCYSGGFGLPMFFHRLYLRGRSLFFFLRHIRHQEWRECVHLLLSARLSNGTLTALCAWKPLLLPIASPRLFTMYSQYYSPPFFSFYLEREFTVNATDGTNDYITCLRDHSTSSNLAIINVRPAYL